MVLPFGPSNTTRSFPRWTHSIAVMEYLDNLLLPRAIGSNRSVGVGRRAVKFSTSPPKKKKKISHGQTRHLGYVGLILDNSVQEAPSKILSLRFQIESLEVSWKSLNSLVHEDIGNMASAFNAVLYALYHSRSCNSIFCQPGTKVLSP